MDEGIGQEQIEQMKQVEEMKKKLLSHILENAAYERLSRIRMVNPNLAGQAELYLLQIYQTGRLKTPVSDAKFKEVLKTLASDNKQINIKRK